MVSTALNLMRIEEPHAHMAESTESTAASSLSLLCQLLDQILSFASSRIDAFFPSFRIHGIVVSNRLHRSSGLSRVVLSADP